MPMKTGTTKARSFKELYEKLNYKNEFGIEYSKSKEVHEKIMKALQKYYVVKQVGLNWYATKINTKDFSCTNGEYIHTNDYIIVNQAGSSKKYKYTNIDDCVLGYLTTVKTRSKLSDSVFGNLKFYQYWTSLSEKYADQEGNKSHKHKHAFEFLEFKICQIIDEILDSAIARGIKSGKIRHICELYVDVDGKYYGIATFKNAKERARAELGINGYATDFSLMIKHNNPVMAEYRRLVEKYAAEELGREVDIVRREITTYSNYELKLEYNDIERIIMTYYYEVIRETLKAIVDKAVVDPKTYDKLSSYKKKTRIVEEEKNFCLKILDEYLVYSDGVNEYYRVSDLPEYKEILDNTMDKYWCLDFRKYFYMTQKRKDND